MRHVRIASSYRWTVASILFLGTLSPAFTGERIAFESATTVRSIWTVDTDTGARLQLTDDTTDDYNPAWSPDRQYIALASARGGTRSIWLVDVATLALTRVTDDGGEDHNPTWSPDGTRIGFRSDGRGAATVSLWAKDRLLPFDDQTAYIRLTDDGGSDYGPAWSPDGSTIAFYSQGTPRDNTAGDHVWAKDLSLPFDEPTAYTRMTDDAGQTYSPYWSPDGSTIGFQTDRWSQWDVGARDLGLPIDDVAAYERLTDSAGIDFSGPVWSPGATAFAFASDTRLTGGVAVSDIWVKTTGTAFDDASGYAVLVQGHHPDWEPAAAGPALVVVPLSLAFGNVPVGRSSAQPFSITGTGAATLTVTDIASDTPVFTVATTPAPPFELPPDLSQTVTVTFTPTVEGPQTADITITHSAVGGPVIVTASGTGVAPPVLQATIDVKPGSSRNPINPRSRGVTSVAVLSTRTGAGETTDFDAANVDTGSVRLGRGGASVERWSLEDIDGDGDDDLLLRFRTQDIGLVPGDDLLCLTGTTLDGVAMHACDAVTLVPPGRRAAPALLTSGVGPNYPNPFNPETWIPFELAEAADVTVRIYGLDGGLVRKLELGARGAGEYVGRESAAYWDGRNADGEAAASGVYVYELTAGDYHALRRMVVMK